MISASMVKELREITNAGMLDCKKALEATNGNMEEAITWLREKGISKALKKSSRIAAEGLAYACVSSSKAVIIEVNSETDFVAKNEEFKKMVSDISDTILSSSDVNTLDDVLNLTCDGGSISDLIVSKTATIGEKLSLRRFKVLSKNENEVFSTYSHMAGKIVTLVKLTGNKEDVAKDVAMHVAAMKPIYLNREDVPSEVLDKERTILREQAVNEGLNESKLDMVVNGRLNKYYEEVCLLDQNFIKENKMKVSNYVKNNGMNIVEFVRYEVGEGIEKRSENFADEVMKQING